MKIDSSKSTTGNRRAGQAAFTLIEVAFSAAIAALVLAGMFQGYTLASRRAQFSACSLAANSQAMMKLEQVTSSTWIESYGTSWNPTYSNYLQLFNPVLTNSQPTNLFLPSVLSNIVTCTNYTYITLIPSSAPYVQIEVKCVWWFPNYGGMFTNTVATLRAPNI